MKHPGSTLAIVCVGVLAGLVGCSAAPSPATTVTVTATPSAPTVAPGDSAPWDLHALCAAESQASTLVVWHDQQTAANRLTPAQAAAVLQSVAVLYLGFDRRALPDPVQQDVADLVAAAGTLEHPSIDLESTQVERARGAIDRTCRAAGWTIGVLAQGG